jgi:iron(III) transport system substrate-binding protein
MSQRGRQFLRAGAAALAAFAFGLAPSRPTGAFEIAVDKLAAAKREGTVVWYSSLVGLSDKVAELFEQQTGVKVQLYNAATGKVISKIETERKAGLVLADVVHHTSLYDVIRWKNAKLLASMPLDEKARASFAPMQIDPDGAWFALRNLTSGIAYNKNSIAANDVPRSFKDLLDPKFDRKIAYMSPSLSGMPQYTVKMLLDLYGWDYYRRLAKLRPHMVESDGNAINMVIAGEVPIAGTIAAYNALNASYKGQPVGIVFPTEGVPVAIAPVAILQNAPHPNAAALFYQFLASQEVGELLSKGGLLSGRSDVEPPRGQPKLAEIKPYFADLGWLAKNERRMAEQFDDIMAR